jgi:K+-sensing histidine kinase KdpD
MRSKDNVFRPLIQFGTLLLALLPLLVYPHDGFLQTPTMPTWGLLLLGLLILLTSTLQISVGEVQTWLTTIVALGVLFAYPSWITLTILISSIGLGAMLRYTTIWFSKEQLPSGWSWLMVVCFEWGQQVGFLTCGLLGFFLLKGKLTSLWRGDAEWLPMLALLVNCWAWQNLTIYGQLFLKSTPQDGKLTVKQHLLYLILPTVLPVLGGYSLGWQLSQLSLFGQMSAILFTSIVIVLTFLLTRHLETLTSGYEQLNALSNVTRSLRTSLNLPALLDTIYLQVAHLLKVDNFYIALYDEKSAKITYPIAIENGMPVHWDERVTANRLTDHVIRTRAPMLIANNLQVKLAEFGFESSDNYPHAWLGVPLTAGGYLLGCMAVLSHNKNVSFGASEQTLLATIASQAAVAIENAQLYSETQQRATELTSLNRITALISATLNPDRVLELVCDSCLQLLGTQKVAAFLLAPEHQELWLARAEGLGDAYLQASLTLSVVHNTRAKTIILQEPVIINDVESVVLDVEWADLLSQEGIKAYLEMPLLTQGKAIGFLSVYYEQPRRFRNSEIDLFRTLATQAALAVANARIYVRTDQTFNSRLEQLQALDSIGREITASLDVQHIFKIVLQRAVAATLAATGLLLIVETTPNDKLQLRVASFLGIIESQLERMMPQRVWPLECGIAGRVFRSGQAEVIADTERDLNHVTLDTASRSILAVPILQESDVLGVIVLESPRAAAFGTDEVTLVSQLAVQAAVAIVNARLYQGTQQRLSEQTLIYETGQIAAAPVWDQALLEKLATKVLSMTNAQAVFLNQYDTAHQQIVTMQFAAQPNWQSLFAQTPPKRAVMPDFPELQLVLEGKVPIVMADGCISTWVGDPTFPEHTFLIVPMLVGEHLIGTLEVFAYAHHDFSDAEIRLAQTVAAQIAIGVQNNRLFQAIRVGHDQLTAVLASIREGIMLIDNTTQVALFNARLSEWFDIPAADILQRGLASLDHPLAGLLGYPEMDNPALADYFSNADLSEPEPKIYSIEQPDETQRFLERSILAVYSDTQERLGYMVVLRDVTVEKELQVARDDFTSMIVHDLRSPLTGIAGSLNLLGDFINLDEQPLVAQTLQIAHRASTRLLSLINSLLDISRLESGDSELETEYSNLNNIGHRIIEEFEPIAQEQGITLIFDPMDDLPIVNIDADKITRVLSNLLDNALKFTPSTKTVKLAFSALPDKKQVLCQVIDEGPGIPAEYRDKVFDRFVQIKGRHGRRRGSGLGLAFCRLAVTAHGGQIWVENRETGGSIFQFTLPYENAPPDFWDDEFNEAFEL